MLSWACLQPLSMTNYPLCNSNSPNVSKVRLTYAGSRSTNGWRDVVRWKKSVYDTGRLWAVI